MPADITEYPLNAVKKIKWEWTSTDGGAVSEANSTPFYGRVVAMVTIPGTGGATPTNNYDITIVDAEGYDVMQGAGANRSDTNTETAVPTAYSVGYGTFTLTIANAGATNEGTVILYIQ